MNIQSRVNNLVKRCGTADPVSIAKMHNIFISFLDLPQTTRGFCVKIIPPSDRRQRIKGIIISDSLPQEASNIVVAHELGHLMLHEGYGYYFFHEGTIFVKSKYETEANEFAAYLLSKSSTNNTDMLAQVIREKRLPPKLVHEYLCRLSL